MFLGLRLSATCEPPRNPIALERSENVSFPWVSVTLHVLARTCLPASDPKVVAECNLKHMLQKIAGAKRTQTNGRPGKAKGCLEKDEYSDEGDGDDL